MSKQTRMTTYQSMTGCDVFIHHAVKDAMRSPKDDIPPLVDPDEETHNEYVRIRTEEQNLCRKRNGRDGARKTHPSLSETKSHSHTTSSKKQSAQKAGNDASSFTGIQGEAKVASRD
jgi:hypothetical protein